MSEPITASGKRLESEVADWDYFGDNDHGMSLVDYIAAIESEAVAAERTRITPTLNAVADELDRVAERWVANSVISESLRVDAKHLRAIVNPEAGALPTAVPTPEIVTPEHE